MGTGRSSAPNGCASKIALTGRSLMREHARLAHRNLQLALINQRTRDLVPGAVLVRPALTG